MTGTKVGDVVWYLVDEPRQQGKITRINGSTHATIRLVTGPQAGQEFEAPWGIIEPLERREWYRGYAIEVAVEALEDGAFTAVGFIRKPHPFGNGIPFETSFATTERHPTADAAIEAGLGFAKKKIDGGQ